MYLPQNRAFLLATIAIIDDLADFEFPNVLMWKIEGCVPNEKNLKLSSNHDFHGYSTKSFKKAGNKIKEVTFEELQEKINDFKEHMKERGKEKYELTDYRYREKVLVTISKKKAATIFLRTITKAIELIADALQKKIEDIDRKFNEHEKVIKMVVQLKTEVETEEKTTVKKEENKGEEVKIIATEIKDEGDKKEIERLKNLINTIRSETINESGSLDYKLLNRIFLVEEVAKFNLQTLILESFNDTSWESLKVYLSKTNLANLKII
jgi:putative cell wall-binding protein